MEILPRVEKLAYKIVLLAAGVLGGLYMVSEGNQYGYLVVGGGILLAGLV